MTVTREGGLAEGRQAKIEFGYENVEMIPLGAIINLRQVRETVDMEEVEKLRQRIPKKVLDNGTSHYDLVHPVMVAFLDREHFQQYLADHDDYYEEKSFDSLDIDLLPTHKGRYCVRISGHMRGLAALRDCEIEGVDPMNANISATLQDNIGFVEANRLQNTENTSIVVKPVEDARSIERHYVWAERKGLPSTIKALSSYFGYSEDKVRAALRFVTAPEYIQKFVNNGLSYTNVVDLIRLQEAYEESLTLKYTELGENERLVNVSKEAQQKMVDYFEVTIVNKLHGRRSSYVSEAIESKIKEVEKSATYITESFFTLKIEDIEAASSRKRNRNEIGKLAVSSIVYLQNIGKLSPEQRKEILTALGVQEDELSDLETEFEEELKVQHEPTLFS